VGVDDFQANAGAAFAGTLLTVANTVGSYLLVLPAAFAYAPARTRPQAPPPARPGAGAAR